MGKAGRDLTPEVATKWVDIPGTKRPCKLGDNGEVIQFIGNRWKKMSIMNYKRAAYVFLMMKDGKRKNLRIRALMRDLFMQGVKEGYVVVNVTDQITDSSLRNLRYVPVAKFHGNNGRKRRKPVAQINERGEVINFFSSMSEASRKTGVAQAVISKHCNGKVKDPFMLRNFSFKFEGDVDDWK